MSLRSCFGKRTHIHRHAHHATHIDIRYPHPTLPSATLHTNQAASKTLHLPSSTIARAAEATVLLHELRAWNGPSVGPSNVLEALEELLTTVAHRSKFATQHGSSVGCAAGGAALAYASSAAGPPSTALATGQTMGVALAATRRGYTSRASCRPTAPPAPSPPSSRASAVAWAGRGSARPSQSR